MKPTAKSKNTKPELMVRNHLHKLGFRFRVHQKIGCVKPDIVMKKWNTCIFVHGCFWHNHEGCKLAYIPKSNTDFWTEKFEKNRARDHPNRPKSFCGRSSRGFELAGCIAVISSSLVIPQPLSLMMINGSPSL